MKKTISIGSPRGLSADGRRSLRCLVALMIPDSTEYEVPGADDEKIFSDIASSLGRDAENVQLAVRHLDAMASGVFADAPVATQRSVTNLFRATYPALAEVLVAATTRCYYRDDRVMQAIGMEPRPPYPKGFAVEQGDWSLLDPVRARGQVYRDVPP